MPYLIAEDVKALIDASTAPAAVTDSSGEILYANEEFARLWRLDRPEDALGKSASHFWTMVGAVTSPLPGEKVCPTSRYDRRLGMRADGTLFKARVRSSTIPPGQKTGVCLTFFEHEHSVGLDMPAPTPSEQVHGSLLLVGSSPALLRLADAAVADGMVVQTRATGEVGDSLLRDDHFDVAVVQVDDHPKGLENLETCVGSAQAMTVICVYESVDDGRAHRILTMRPDATCLLPDEEGKLLLTIHRLLRQARFLTFIRDTNQALREWLNLGEDWLTLVGPRMPSDSSMHVDWHIRLAQSKMRRILDNLASLTRSLAGSETGLDACQFFRCPRLEKLIETLECTVETIEGTRKAFKSKELGYLRKELESTLAEVRKAMP